jgi:hypothetical protein
VTVAPVRPLEAETARASQSAPLWRRRVASTIGGTSNRPARDIPPARETSIAWTMLASGGDHAGHDLGVAHCPQDWVQHVLRNNRRLVCVRS